MITDIIEIIKYTPHRPSILKRLCAFVSLCLLGYSLIYAQADITIKSAVLGKAEVTASNTITLSPGFETASGSDFYAHISSSSTTTYPSATSVSTDATSSSSTTSTQSSDYNYIRTITYREALTSAPESGTSFSHLEQVDYFDGLGRPMQTVMVKGSPTKTDIIQPVLYDNYGRETIKPMPYIDGSSTGSYRSGISNTSLDPITNFYKNLKSDEKAYTTIGYDNSPLNRVVSQTGPGSAWSSKSTTIDYQTNTSEVKGWDVSDDYSYTENDYEASTLYVTQTTDEEGHVTKEYKDKQGQVVLKESVLDNNTTLKTYYIYDDFGLLRCVVPPLASDPNTQTGLCYYYLYDSRHRMIEKKIPGGGTVKMVYDSRDRLRLTQNSLQNASNEWSFTKYDALNRPVETGVFTSSSTITVSALETAINAATLSESYSSSGAYAYTSNSYPTSGTTIQSVTWYDDYNYQTALNFASKMMSDTYDADDYTFSSAKDVTPVGRVTGTMTKVLTPTGDNSISVKANLYSSVYYDKYGNVLRSVSQNVLDGVDITSTCYQPITFLPLKTKQQHISSTENDIIQTRFDYDHTGRVLATYLKVNNQDEITQSKMEYNVIGELTTKYLHSDQTSGTESFRQKTDYTYNIRGWLTSINDPSLGSDNDLFGMNLCYNDITNMGSLSATGLFNGNISGMKWQVANDKVRGFSFTYDNLNRLKTSSYADGSSLTDNAGAYNENIPEYDNNGNIKQLERYYAGDKVDALTYTYNDNSNQIASIADAGKDNTNVNDYSGAGDEYEYDANGNMTNDGGRAIELTYNPTINLPYQVDFEGNNRIFYYYTAGGAKMLKHVVPSSGTETTTAYIGNFVYENGTLAYILTSEGRLIPNGSGTDRTFLYEYTLKDHLGNSRVTFMGTDLGNAIDVVQTNSYYSFGLTLQQTNGNTSDSYQKNKYLYNGKEIQDDNLNGKFFGMLDYGARFYDPQIGRWNSTDPLAETYESWSLYNYALNNPLSFIDPNGLWVETAGGYSTNDPEDIARFMEAVQTEKAINNKDADINMMSNFIDGEMNGGGRLSDGSYLISEVSVTKTIDNKFKPEIQSYNKAWNEINSIYTGEKFHLFPIEGEPVMDPLEHWYEKLWYGLNGGREYCGQSVDAQGRATGNLKPIVGYPPNDITGVGPLKMTQWGWTGTQTWKSLIKTVKSGGNIETLLNKIPTRQEAIKLIEEAGGKIKRTEGGHLPPNPHTYPHINYTTPSGGIGTIRILNL